LLEPDFFAAHGDLLLDVIRHDVLLEPRPPADTGPLADHHFLLRSRHRRVRVLSPPLAVRAGCGALAAALAASMASQDDPRLKEPIEELRAAVKLEEQI
jgi:hypothetical protein